MRKAYSHSDGHIPLLYMILIFITVFIKPTSELYHVPAESNPTPHKIAGP